MLPQFTRGLELRPHNRRCPQSKQHREELRGLSHLLTQFPRPGVGLFRFRSTPALDGPQRRAEGGLHVQLLPGPVGGVRQGREHLEPLGQMPDRFQIGGALDGALAGLLPIRNRLGHRAGLRIVMGQQLGLGLAELGKARLQHLGNTLMVLLPRTLQQGLIGRVLDQGVLEEVRRLWRQPPLIQKLAATNWCSPRCTVPSSHGETACSSS